MKRDRFQALILFTLLLPVGRFLASECPVDERPVSVRIKTLPKQYSGFSARALRVEKLGPCLVEVHFEVSRSWRGVNSPYVTVRSSPCELQPSFEQGVEYLVFALPGPASTLEAAECSDTRRLKDAD